MSSVGVFLPPQVMDAIARLEAAGFEAYAVGGCVRDCLLGKTPKDFDIATSALPRQTERVFSDGRIAETGLKHGTVTALLGGMPIEITTFRVDKGYTDGRHPDEVLFTESLREDAARRDFTINAMAYNERDGLIDYFGGERDLRLGVLRCVGSAQERFTEDALRILRALRFLSELGFEIENETSAAISRCAPLLALISAERVCAEIARMLCGKDVTRVIMGYTDALGVVLPELLPMKGFKQRNPHHIYDVLEHTAIAVSYAPPVVKLRLAALLHDAGKPFCFSTDENGVGHFYGHAEESARIADAALKRLKLDNRTRERAVLLVRVHDKQIENTDSAVRRALSRLTPEVFFELISLKRADNMAQSPEYRGRQAYYDELEQTARRLLSEKACLRLSDLEINGRDIISLGVAPGKAVGETLSRLLEAVISGELPNERDRLMERAEALAQNTKIR